MPAKNLDLRLAAESIGGVPLPFGADDVESTFTPPPDWNAPVQAGTSTVNTKSRRSDGTVVFRAAIGSARYKALSLFRVRSKVPGFLGEEYVASIPEAGQIVTGRLLPQQVSGRALAETVQTVEFTCSLVDVSEIELPAPGLAS
jgi:hypothetical protein